MISCGKFDKRYFTIFFIFLILNIIIIIITCVFAYVSIIYLRFLSGLPSLLDPLLKYFGMFLCIIPELILKLRIKSSNNNKSKQITNSKRVSGFIEYIYTDLSDTMKLRDYINLGLMSLLLLIIDFLRIFLKKKEYSSYSQYIFIELPFLLIISTYIYKIDYYKHQYVSLIVLIVCGLIQYIIKTAYYFKETSDLENVLIELGLLILIGFGNAIFLSYSKGLMQFKFFSPYKVCYIFGLINGIIILILYFIVSGIKCSGKSVLCDVEYKGNYYFDNIYMVMSGYNIGQKLLLILYGILDGAIKLLYNIIINYYSVCHIFFFLQNKGIADSIGSDIVKKYNYFLQILTHILGAIGFFFALVFIEMVQLNFWGLNENLKVNIQKRINEENRLTTVGTFETEGGADTEQNEEDEQNSSFDNDISKD